MTCSQQALLQRLRFGYIAALTVIVAALLVSGVTIFVALRQQEQDAQVLNVVARQRTLSQRLSKAALRMVSPGMGGLRWDRAAELRGTLEQWRAAQTGLLEGDSALGLPGHPTASFRAALLASTPWFETMTEATDSVLTDTSLALRTQHVSAILGAEGQYLKAAEHATDVYRNETTARLHRVQTAQFAATAIIVAIIILLGMLVLRPAEARIRRSIEEMLAKDATLVEQAADLLQANARLDIALDEATALARLKSEFLANMSHEIRTPLNGVLGMTALLLDSPLSPDQRESVQMIHSSGDGLLTIINDVLDFSKVEAGRVELESVAFDPQHVAEEVIELLAPRAGEKHLELALIASPSLPHRMAGDPTRVRQVLLNFLGNAIKFTASGEVVVSAAVIESSPGGRTLRFEVRDTGIGIAPEVRPRLFRSFSQGDGSTTRRFGGTGLGLAISKQLVQLMGGDIGYDSISGQGSTFWFTLPLHASDATPPARPVLTRRRLIVAAAHGPTRESILCHAVVYGIEGIEARDAGELLALVARQRGSGEAPLILIDSTLPGAFLPTLLGQLRGLAVATAARISILAPHGARLPDPLPGTPAILTRPLRRSAFLREASAPLAPPASASEAELSHPRVLVVENNPVNRAVVSRHLHKLGCTVEAVGTGTEALQRIGAERFDLVLMDCHMPGMDGFDTTLAIRTREAPGTRLPIVALTADSGPEDRARCLTAGMDDHLSKPFKPEELRATIQRWLPLASNRVSDQPLS